MELEPEEAHYVARVLRFRHGDRLALIDGEGQLWTATLEQPAMLKLEQPLEQPLERAGRPRPTITLAMAVPKRDAELAWRMATELGASQLRSAPASWACRFSALKPPSFPRKNQLSKAVSR